MSERRPSPTMRWRPRGVPRASAWPAVVRVWHGMAGHHVDQGSYSFDFPQLKRARDGYVARLNGIYRNNLSGSGVSLLEGAARFVGPRELEVEVADGGTVSVSAEHVLIATGGAPTLPDDIPGVRQLAIDSDGFFEMCAPAPCPLHPLCSGWG